MNVAETISAIKTAYENEPLEAISEIDSRLAAKGTSLERQAALRQLRAEFVAICHEARRIELLEDANIEESLWSDYRYDSDTDTIVYEGGI